MSRFKSQDTTAMVDSEWTPGFVAPDSRKRRRAAYNKARNSVGPTVDSVQEAAIVSSIVDEYDRQEANAQRAFERMKASEAAIDRKQAKSYDKSVAKGTAAAGGRQAPSALKKVVDYVADEVAPLYAQVTHHGNLASGLKAMIAAIGGRTSALEANAIENAENMASLGFGEFGGEWERFKQTGHVFVGSQHINLFAFLAGLVPLKATRLVALAEGEQVPLLGPATAPVEYVADSFALADAGDEPANPFGFLNTSPSEVVFNPAAAAPTTIDHDPDTMTAIIVITGAGATSFSIPASGGSTVLPVTDLAIILKKAEFQNLTSTDGTQKVSKNPVVLRNTLDTTSLIKMAGAMFAGSGPGYRKLLPLITEGLGNVLTNDDGIDARLSNLLGGILSQSK